MLELPNDELIPIICIHSSEDGQRRSSEVGQGGAPQRLYQRCLLRFEIRSGRQWRITKIFRKWLAAIDHPAAGHSSCQLGNNSNGEIFSPCFFSRDRKEAVEVMHHLLRIHLPPSRFHRGSQKIQAVDPFPFRFNACETLLFSSIHGYAFVASITSAISGETSGS
jgi:hypothetical protein